MHWFERRDLSGGVQVADVEKRRPVTEAQPRQLLCPSSLYAIDDRDALLMLSRSSCSTVLEDSAVSSVLRNVTALDVAGRAEVLGVAV